MRKWVIIGLILVLLFFIAMGTIVFTHSSYPERAILGEWKEVSWVYQLSNNKKTKAISTEERFSMLNHLVVHEYENWTFTTNYQLKLHQKDGNEHYSKWRLKGRGHILTIENKAKLTETYSIEALNKNQLLLHFQTDNQARGIVKITLQKVS